MRGITRHINEIGEGGSSSPLPLLDSIEPFPLHKALVVFIVVLLLLSVGWRMGGVGTLSLNCPITFYKDLLLRGIGYKILGKKEPWGIIAAPILVVVVGDASIQDIMVEVVRRSRVWRFCPHSRWRGL